METTAAKLEANRRNALNSTGPKTAEGKAASSRNATRHGLTASGLTLMSNERQEDLDALIAATEAEFNPGTETERFLVHQMVQARWRLVRLARLEAEALDGLDDRDLITAMERPGNIFDKLERYRIAAGRAFSKALRELAGLRAKREKSASQNKASAARQWYANAMASLEQRYPVPSWEETKLAMQNEPNRRL